MKRKIECGLCRPTFGVTATVAREEKRTKVNVNGEEDSEGLTAR